MKNLILIIALTLLIASCQKDNNPNTNGIVIKGNIPATVKSTDSKTDNAVSLSDATKVLVFSKYYYKLYDITDGNFSVTGQLGTGIALIFLDANNQYIGNLSSQGLNMLPLGNLTNGDNTQIDLSTLRLEGNSVIPSHDPLGNEIIISETEIKSLRSISTYYQSIAKNLSLIH